MISASGPPAALMKREVDLRTHRAAADHDDGAVLRPDPDRRALLRR